jgi:F0F1-type ATP synthase membrane subunit b/b'
VFLSLDGTSIVQLINFAIFFAILSAVFLRPVGAAIVKRRAYIDSVTRDAERYRLEAQSLHAEADAKRTAARRTAEELMVRSRGVADAEAAEIVARFTDRANAIAGEAREEVEAEVRAARGRESELAEVLARGLLDRAVGAGK